MTYPYNPFTSNLDKYNDAWKRDLTNGYLYPKTLTDKVGIGTDSPSQALDIDNSVDGVASDFDGIRVRSYRPNLNLIDRSAYGTGNGHNFQIKADLAQLQFNTTSIDDETFDVTNMFLDYEGKLAIASLTASLGVYTNASKQLTSTPPTSGDLGFWNRDTSGDAFLTPATSGDNFKVSGVSAFGNAGVLISKHIIDLNHLFTDAGIQNYGAWISPTFANTTSNSSGGAIVGYAITKGANCTGDISGLNFGTYGVFSTFVTTAAVSGADIFGHNAYATNSTIPNLYGARITSYGDLTTTLVGSLNVTNAYNLFVKAGDSWSDATNVTNEVGLYIEKPTLASNNYQAVLEGNGTGSGIWFDGKTGERLYSDGNNLIIPKTAAASPYATALTIGTGHTTNSAGYGIVFPSSATAGFYSMIAGRRGAGGAGENDLVFLTGKSSPTERMVIYDNGTIQVNNKLFFTQSDGNEYIDSLADGYMDYGATTAHRFNNTLDITTATDPQLRLTHTDGVDETDFYTNSDGDLEIMPTSRTIYLGDQSAGDSIFGFAGATSIFTLSHDDSEGTLDLSANDTTNYASIARDGEINLHGTARVYKNQWINVQGLKAPGTKPASAVDWGISCGWEFSDGTDDTICSSIRLPQDMDRTVAPELKIGFASDTNTGDVVWQLEYLYLSPNEDTTASAQETLTTTATISGTADGLTIATITGLDLPSSTDQLMRIRIKRLGADGDDTLGDDCVLLGCGLKYVADKLGQAT